MTVVDDGRLVVLVRIPGDPHPAERPRFARSTGHTYVPTTTTKAVKAVRSALREACPLPERNLDLRVWLTFRRAGRARTDVDNLAKTVLDAAKGAVWNDDAQVVELHVRKVVGVGAARAETVVKVERVVAGEVGR